MASLAKAFARYCDICVAAIEFWQKSQFGDGFTLAIRSLLGISPSSMRALLSLVASGALTTLPGAMSATLPNILFILADDMVRSGQYSLRALSLQFAMVHAYVLGCDSWGA